MQALRNLFTALWLAIGSPRKGNGILSILRTPPLYFAGFIDAPLSEPDRAAMQQNLTDKYGIRQIEDDE